LTDIKTQGVEAILGAAAEGPTGREEDIEAQVCQLTDIGPWF
jgi:hypothetical protein